MFRHQVSSFQSHNVNMFDVQRLMLLLHNLVYKNVPCVALEVYQGELLIYYNNYKNGRPMVEILAEVERAYNIYKAEHDFDVSSITDFNHVQDKICYKLINRDKNKELLADTPYLPFQNLAVIFYIWL